MDPAESVFSSSVLSFCCSQSLSSHSFSVSLLFASCYKIYITLLPQCSSHFALCYNAACSSPPPPTHTMQVAIATTITGCLLLPGYHLNRRIYSAFLCFEPVIFFLCFFGGGGT